MNESHKKADVDIEGTVKMFKDWQKVFVGQFNGIPVRVDRELEGNQYYIAVSEELRVEIETQAGTR